MEKVIVKGGFPLSPLPAVIVSCQTVEQPLALSIAWTGIVNSAPFRMYISVQPVRNSYQPIIDSGEFVINMMDKSMLYAIDYCGSHSGRDVDKFSACNLTAVPGTEVSAPLIGQATVSIECKICQVLHLGSHDMLIADVVAVHADPEIVDERGIICFDRTSIVGYANRQYFAQEKHAGDFGCAVALMQQENQP